MAESGSRARLFVLSGPDVARSFEVSERALLGRADECQVRLTHRSISRKHAVLAREGAAWFVQDLGSTNGLASGGKKVERLELRDGDEFQLGDVSLRFRIASETEPAVELEFVSPAPPPGPVPQAARALRIASTAARAPPGATPAAPRPAPREGEIAIEEEIEIGGEEPGPALAATMFSPPRAKRRTGFFSGELEQRPLWMRALLVVLILALSAGLFLAAFRGVALLRSSL